MEVNKIYQGDCIEVMRTFPDNSVDTIITDPPYGLEFMGKEWDAPWKGKAGKDFNTSCEGKLGGFKKLPNYTRGNNTKCLNCDHWKFSSNPCKCDNPKFPHTQQLAMIKFQEWYTEVSVEMLRVLKPGGTLLTFGGTRTYHRMACAVEDAGFILKDCIMWLYGSGFPKATDISKQLDKGYKREVIGKNINAGLGRNRLLTDDNWKGIGSKVCDITAPATLQAKLWNGWKSHGLKPAYEPIIVAMKPNEGTYASNALRWGVSGLWIDGGRIDMNDRDEYEKKQKSFSKSKSTKGYGEFEASNPATRINKQGRFPANVILECICDEVGEGEDKIAKNISFKEEKQADGWGTKRCNTEEIKTKSVIHTNPNCPCYMLDEQSGIKASRFYYVSKASKSERNAGCEGLEEKKVSDGREKEADNAYQRGKTLRQNTHPTVKSLKLMEYLCKLTKTPTGGIVLDPFAGSCTTAVACIKEKRPFIMIEREAEYVKIGNARIASVPEPML